GTELILGWIIVHTELGHLIFNTAALPLYIWLIPLPFALLIFFGDELRKLLLRRGNKFVEKWLVW
ncbi:hypothetical protein GOV10_00735, partial [Candidatus Woesearchaeota archaeon]|nr:hypothetical protein [Candidatus Woesearchaeota archaeon]